MKHNQIIKYDNILKYTNILKTIKHTTIINKNIQTYVKTIEHNTIIRILKHTKTFTNITYILNIITS